MRLLVAVLSVTGTVVVLGACDEVGENARPCSGSPPACPMVCPTPHVEDALCDFGTWVCLHDDPGPACITCSGVVVKDLQQCGDRECPPDTCPADSPACRARLCGIDAAVDADAAHAVDFDGGACGDLADARED